MTMSDFAIFLIFAFILFGFIFISGFMCGYTSSYFDKRITADMMKKLIANEPSLNANMIYKKYKKHYPMLTKRFIRRALKEEPESETINE